MIEKMNVKKWSDVPKSLTVEGSSWLNEEGRVVNRIDLKPYGIGIERRLQELSDTINECVDAQKEENQRFWNYLMHLKNHMHQFVVYMKKKNKDFPDSLLQSFNYQASTEDALAAEAVAESKEKSESKEEPPSTEEEK